MTHLSADLLARLAPAELEAARAASSEVVVHTPVLSAASLSARCGGTIALKAESLQRTGSFKLRGAMSKLGSLGPDTAGVVAGSAGNHAQALAYAARVHGLPCEVFMPVDAAISKVAAVRAFGAQVEQRGDSVDACVQFARERAEQAGLAFVHPFDDPEIIRGQAGLGLELAEDVADLATVVVPIGGGGLAAGVAAALKQTRPRVRVVGVQAQACAAVAASLREHRAVTVSASQTIADGIAIKRPGTLTLPLIEHWLDDVVTVSEEAIAEAMVRLAERAKLVVEGAGAASLAALLCGAVTAAEQGTTVAILSGGNVDASVLAAVAARAETTSGRRVRVLTRVPDRPGGLAALLALIAGRGANVLDVTHVRDGVDLGVRETGVELTLEIRDREHVPALERALGEAGYDTVEIH